MSQTFAWILAAYRHNQSALAAAYKSSLAPIDDDLNSMRALRARRLHKGQLASPRRLGSTWKDDGQCGDNIVPSRETVSMPNTVAAKRLRQQALRPISALKRKMGALDAVEAPQGATSKPPKVSRRQSLRLERKGGQLGAVSRPQDPQPSVTYGRQTERG
jgi:hypothetical protein